MDDKAQQRTISRLISIKREELDRYRQDLQRLGQMVLMGRRELELARQSERSFLEDIRQSESALGTLSVQDMLERRRYLAFLREKAMVQSEMLAQVEEQQQQAQGCVDTAFAEMKSLERVAERLVERLHRETQRKNYVQADDQEVVRSLYQEAING